MKNYIIIILMLFLLINSSAQNADITATYHSCTSCTSSNPTYDLEPIAFNSLAISSDYGRRDCPNCSTLWHRGIDYNANNTTGDNDIGYHLLALDSGIVTNIRYSATYKYIVIQGSNYNFGYGHIFRNNSTELGDLSLKPLNDNNSIYAIVYHPSDGDTLLFHKKMKLQYLLMEKHS